MSAETADEHRSTVPARLQDRLWHDTVDAVRAVLRPGDLVLAHDDFRRVLPNVVNYEVRRGVLDASIDHFVLHKGLLGDVDPDYLEEALGLVPRFANEVFVLLSRRGGTLPVDQRDHLSSLYQSARSLLGGPEQARWSRSAEVEGPFRSRSRDETGVLVSAAGPDPEGDMERAGQHDLESIARHPVLVVSPHLDDAVLSCGALLADRPGSTVLTVFAGGARDWSEHHDWDHDTCGFATGTNVVELRREEDGAAVSLLRGSPVWLDLPEDQYAGGAAPSDQVIVDLLRANLTRIAPNVVCVPLGLDHPDHTRAARCCSELVGTIPSVAEWYAYGEFPYVVGENAPTNVAGALLRLSQLCPVEQQLVREEDTERKRLALGCYASQIRGLGQETVDRSALGPERFWRLAPPRLPDRFWEDAADAVRADLREGDVVLAPDEFRRALPDVVDYGVRRRALDAQVDHYVLHKGRLGGLDPGYLAEALQLTPRFANEVFVVVSRRGGRLPDDQLPHLAALHESARALFAGAAGRDLSPPPEAAARRRRQPPKPTAIHLVGSLPYLEGGMEQHTIGLYDLLAPHADVSVWSVRESNRAMSRRIPVQRLDEAGDRFPRGGTIVLLGTFWRIGPWIERAEAERVILIHTIDESDRLVRRIQELAAYGVCAELSFVSGGLLSRSGAYGSVGHPPVDLTRFRPAEPSDDRKFVVGRMSRDDSSKHHPGDLGVYRRLVEAGCTVRIMGGSPVARAWRSTGTTSDRAGALQVLPVGAVDPAEFLRGLSCFFYRTGFRLDGTRLYEGGGLVVAEALACGLPVVAERFGGYVDWVEHGRSGFLFDEPDEAVEQILRLANDAALVRSMGDSARARAEELFGVEETNRLLEYFGVA